MKRNDKVQHPIREVLQAMTGVSPPWCVRGYDFKNLNENQVQVLQAWCVKHARPSWLTGIGLMDAAESQVQEAVSNGNIPPPPEQVGSMDRCEDRYDHQTAKTLLEAGRTEMPDTDFLAVVEKLRAHCLEVAGMPQGSFSFALAWMRKGKQVRMKSAPRSVFSLQSGQLMCAQDGGVPFPITSILTEALIQLDWELVE